MTDSPLVTEKQLARTYDGSAYDDAWQAVEQYRHVRQYQADHPEQGYTAIANTLEYPTGRVRSWYDGKTPYVVEAIETAHDYGWIGVTYDDPKFDALNTLVASMFSGGSINGENWMPKWTLNECGYSSPVIDTLKSVGVGHTDHEEATDTSAPVVRPERDGAVLGRILHVLGVPIGKKSKLEDFSLPWHLEDAPVDVRKTFVQAYVGNRGYEDYSSESMQIIKERPQSYRRELAELIESVAGAPVRAGEESVTISADAARSLGL